MNKLDTLLLVSPSQHNRKLLRDVLSTGYNLLEASNLQQALLLFRQNRSCIVAFILDISGQETISQDLLEVQDQAPLILICETDTAEVLHMGFGFGAADVIPMHYDTDSMRHRIDTITQLHNHKLYLQRMVLEQAEKLRTSNEVMVDALSSIIECRSVESGQHILRIRHFTKILLEEVRRCCPEYRLTDEIISVITSAAALHDIGKIAIPDAILMKPGKLTPLERSIMQTHSLTGCQILESLANMGNEEYLRYAHNICHYHHERWDGRGYPEGLKGDSIPICAQVVGLADVYDALTSKRVYKDAYAFETAVNMILKGECGIFSPKLLECFKHVLDQFKALASAYADGLTPKSEIFDVTLPEPVPDDNPDSFERVQGKYLCLLHYLNSFVLELFIDHGHFHLRYNPYPEFSVIGQATSLQEIESIVLDQLVLDTERDQMHRLIHQGIEDFLQAGLRRQSFLFHLRKRDAHFAPYDITLLRANVNQASNRSLAVICRRLKSADLPCSPVSGSQNQPSSLPPAYTYCCCNDRHFTFVRTGDNIFHFAGYTPQEIRDRFHGQLIHLIHPADRDYVLSSIRQQLNTGTAGILDYRIECKDGTIQWISNNFQLTTGNDGREYLYCTVTDISRYKAFSDALQNRLDRYEIILAQTENALFDWDIPTDTISFSDTWEKIFGYAPISRDVRSVLMDGTFLHPDDMPLLMDGVASLENGSHYETVEVRIATAKGRYIWCRFRASAIRDESGALVRICGIIINIDAEKQAERDLQERAERDALTKLLNKQATRKQVEEYLLQYPKGVHCALLIIDLDNFKQVNDRYGHLFGDSVLTQAARTIQKMFRTQDVIGRIGGDEFLVLMRGIADRKLLESRCQRLIVSFHQAFQHQHQPLPLSCSIGIALSPEHGTSYYQLFQNADKALYRAKAQGRNCYVIYSPGDVAFRLQNSSITAVSNRIDSDSEPGLADSSLVQYAFHRLYTTSDFDASVRELLTIVGQKMNVSRVYVFENSDDNRFCSNTYEWCNQGIPPEIDNLQNISYETDIPQYEDNFNEQGIFYCPDIHQLPKRAYDIVAPQGIKSMLHCAIRENGVFRGYIGFDECVTPRFWTKDQIQMLTYFSEMLSVFLLKKRKQDKALQHTREVQAVLDNQSAWIYVIDPDTHRLKYRNAKVRALAPEAQSGDLCYKALMGRDTPCPGCPAADIRSCSNQTVLMENNIPGKLILADASLIQWNGETCCMLSCRQIPENIPLHFFGENAKCNAQ